MRKDQEKCVPSGSSSDSLVPDRLESLWRLEKLDKRVSTFPLFSQKKKCVKIHKWNVSVCKMRHYRGSRHGSKNN